MLSIQRSHPTGRYPLTFCRLGVSKSFSASYAADRFALYFFSNCDTSRTAPRAAEVVIAA